MKIEGLASRAKGIVARRELLEAGVSEGQIRHRLEVGALLIEYDGVYTASATERPTSSPLTWLP